jgi:hypothetical protein
MATIIPFAGADDLMEFTAALERYTSSINHWDVDTFVDIEAEAIGLGSYNRYIINNKTIDKERRKKDLKTILSQYEYYDVNMLTLRADVFGNTGIASGTVKVSRKHREYPEINAKRRWSSTWVKTEGEWKLIFFHQELIDSHQ